MQPGHAEQRTHDYVRHGTTTLFAALEIATGQVTALCKPRHRHQEFLVFLRHVARAYPDQQLHVVMDNYAAHKRPEVRAWLLRHGCDNAVMPEYLAYTCATAGRRTPTSSGGSRRSAET